MTKRKTVIRPQPGPQTEFLKTSADVCIFGGAAGGGKTFGLMLENTRNINVRGFGSVIFRRESSQIANEGGPWDTALNIFLPLGFKPVESPMRILKNKRKGVKISFSHMQHEKHMYQWDGAQVALICFDELQHFTAKQFWYMFSRNRSTCGVRPYVRATCNPDPDSFLVDLLAWWIDQETGDPIRERSGVIRWFIRLNGEVHWADTKKELHDRFDGPDEPCYPKSLTFIMSSLEDNQELLKKDPGYKANIEAMFDYEKKRLKGNWFVRPSAGELFKREYFDIIDSFKESDVLEVIRYWDRAATKPSEVNPDPDYTAGVLMAKMAQGYYVVVDVVRFRKDPGEVEEEIDAVVTRDGEVVILGLEQEPGASGKTEANYYVKKYPDYDVRTFPKTKDKLTCWKPAARAARRGEIKLLKAKWNNTFLNELESVTDGTQKGHDDQTDGFSGAYNFLSEGSFGIASYKGAT